MEHTTTPPPPPPRKPAEPTYRLHGGPAFGVELVLLIAAVVAVAVVATMKITAAHRAQPVIPYPLTTASFLRAGCEREVSLKTGDSGRHTVPFCGCWLEQIERRVPFNRFAAEGMTDAESRAAYDACRSRLG